MAEDFQATSINKGKGGAEFLEVEDLIRQTLEESKKLEKIVAPTPGQPAALVEKKEEFKATTFVAPPKPVVPQEKPLVAPQPKAPPAPAKAAPTGAYEATFKEYQIGDIVQGTVLKVDPSGVLVDIKYKADGLILPEELAEKIPGSPDEVVKVGDRILVAIENLENKEGYVVLSKKKADYERKWKLVNDALRSKKLLEGKVIQALKGGLIIDCGGIRGFVPASQVIKGPEEAFESFVGRVIPVKVIEINRRQGKIVFSNRQAAGEKEKLDGAKIIDELEVGQVRKGKVANLKSFGAFVDLGGIEGLIHITELSWKRVKHPSEVLKSGEEIEVLVIGVDKVNRKVSLGLKELQDDPWEKAAELYKPGQIIKAKILRFAKFGAFAELEQGLEGLIHLSELSKEPVQRPEDAVKIGDTVDVKILRVQPAEQRIGLSIKELLIDKERQGAKEANAAANVTNETKPVTIGDMIAEKERARAEKEAEESEEIATEAEESAEDLSASDQSGA